MKQRITVDEILELSPSQRERLNSIWLPEVYDLAVANICTDADKETYELMEFVIGEIIVQQSYGKHFYNLTLRDIRGMTASNPACNEDEEEESQCDEDFEEFEFENTIPEYFNKSDCIPLLSVGQMMKLLKDQSYGDGSFYADVDYRQGKYGIGRDIRQYVSYGNDFEKLELCDVLWEALKELL